MAAYVETDTRGRVIRSLIPMVGKKYGHVTVLARVPPRYFASGCAHAMVQCRCDCGEVFEANAAYVRAKMNQCRICAKQQSAEVNRARSHRLPSGRTWVEVARASGVSLNTVTQRWLRGWPEEDLGLPVRGKRPRPVIRYRQEPQP